jgi:hypothetical protein
MAASSVVFTLTPESNPEGPVLRDFVAAYRAWERMQGIRRSLVSALTVCSVGVDRGRGATASARRVALPRRDVVGDLLRRNSSGRGRRMAAERRVVPSLCARTNYNAAPGKDSE